MTAHYVLAADIGGTNARFALVDTEKWTVLLRHDLKTPGTIEQFGTEITTFLELAIAKVDTPVTEASLAVAGRVEGNAVRISQHDVTLSEDVITKHTPLERVVVLNDFQAVGFATNVLKRRHLRTLQKGKPHTGVRTCFGAGTGLGMAICYHDQGYIAIPTEGGHMSLPIQTREEQELLEFFHRRTALSKEYLIYQDILSGKGLETLYAFYQRQHPKLPEGLTAAQISKKRRFNKAAKQAFRLFSAILARFARDIALATLPFDGLFLYGGIAMKNAWMLDKAFLKEFQNYPLHKKALQDIPLYLIKTTDASLLGAGYALTR